MREKLDGIDEMFGYGYIIDDSPILKEVMKQRGKDPSGRDFSVLNRKRAITQVKTCLSNVWNALNVHGKKILDDKGEIDVELYKLYENNIRVQSGLIVDTNLTHPFKALKDFDSVEISLKRAEELQLI
jgi:hypothetical protein